MVCTKGTFLGVSPTGKNSHFETVDAMRAKNGKVSEHWGVANFYWLRQQLGALPGYKSK
jgi:predicted ester cyclase